MGPDSGRNRAGNGGGNALETEGEKAGKRGEAERSETEADWRTCIREQGKRSDSDEGKGKEEVLSNEGKGKEEVLSDEGKGRGGGGGERVSIEEARRWMKRKTRAKTGKRVRMLSAKKRTTRAKTGKRERRFER